MLIKFIAVNIFTEIQSVLCANAASHKFKELFSSNLVIPSEVNVRHLDLERLGLTHFIITYQSKANLNKDEEIFELIKDIHLPTFFLTGKTFDCSINYLKLNIVSPLTTNKY